MPAYDGAHRPPTPVAEVSVAHPTSEAAATVRGKLDTGADVTVIPERLISLLDLAPNGRIWARTFDGTLVQRYVYYVRLAIEGHSLSAIRSVAVDRSDALIGRNVLNRFLVTLDGKNLTFEIEDR